MKSRFILLSIMLILLLGSACVTIQHQKTTESNSKEITVSFIVTADNYHKEFSVKALSGENAFDLLKENTELEFKQYSFGKFITSINGIKPKDQEYWAIYVNNKYSDKGLEAIKPEKNMTIELKLEKIQN